MDKTPVEREYDQPLGRTLVSTAQPRMGRLAVQSGACAIPLDLLRDLWFQQFNHFRQ